MKGLKTKLHHYPNFGLLIHHEKNYIIWFKIRARKIEDLAPKNCFLEKSWNASFLPFLLCIFSSFSQIFYCVNLLILTKIRSLCRHQTASEVVHQKACKFSDQNYENCYFLKRKMAAVSKPQLKPSHGK